MDRDQQRVQQREDVTSPTRSPRHVERAFQRSAGPLGVARHELPVFFALTFVLSWLFWPFTLLNPDSSPLVPFGPLLAAVEVTALAGGRRAALALLRQLTRWRVHAIW